MVSKRARSTNSLGTRLSAIQEGMQELQAKTRTPADDGSTTRLEVVERKVDLLSSANYRREQDRLVMGEDYVYGILDQGYIRRNAYGPAYVSINGTLTSNPCEWASLYVPSGPRTVKLARLPGESYLILGQTDSIPNTLVKEYPITLLNDWWPYNERNNTKTWSDPRATVLPSGIVSLRGMVSKNGTPGTNEILGTIPAAIAPDYDQYFYVNNGDVARGVIVGSDGTIKAAAGASTFTANQFVSLDTIHYPGKGVATWTNIGSGGSSWGANFVDYNYMGVPAAFWKDPYGFVWFRGLAKVAVATSTDNTVIINMPSTHRSYLEQHFRTVGNDVYAGIGSGPVTATPPTPGVVWKTNSPATVGSWISLAGALLNTSDANTINTWWTLDWRMNSWINNSVNQPPAGATRRADGLVYMRGLVSSGTYGVKIGNLPDDYIPRQRLLIDNISGNARGRIDMRGVVESPNDDRGSIYFAQGTASSWMGLDGIAYAP